MFVKLVGWLCALCNKENRAVYVKASKPNCRRCLVLRVAYIDGSLIVAFAIKR